ncbi:MAG TPA: hypothetical protein VFZ59_07045 [Verrucomicrobiae bacterium]|nr:hypothetical protein [Verrucomicrobiae bacterium]
MKTIHLGSNAGIRFIACLLMTIGATALLLSTIEARGQGVLYTDRSIFNTVLQSSTTVDFEGLPPYDGMGIGESPITVLNPVFPFNPILTVTNFEHRLFVAGGSSPMNPAPGTGQYIWNFDSSYPMGIFFPAGRNAFGADFSGGIALSGPFNATLTFTLLSGQTYTHNFTGQIGSWTFRGFVFSESITSVVYNDGGPFLPGGHEEMIDNVTYGVAVPEPQVFSLLVAGLLVRFCRKRPGV